MRICTARSITASFRYTINGKVFQGRSNALILQTIHHVPPQFRYQKRIFPVTFQDSSPPRITGYIQNWRIHVGISQCLRLFSGYFTRLIHQCFIPSAPNTNRCRKRSRFRMVQTMYSFIREIYWNSQASFLYKPTLDRIDRFSMITERIN